MLVRAMKVSWAVAGFCRRELGNAAALLLSAILFVAVATYSFMPRSSAASTSVGTPMVPSAMVRGNYLDGCYHVYVDVGTNVGVQMRKLYEPHLVAGAGALGMYDKFFGAKRYGKIKLYNYQDSNNLEFATSILGGSNYIAFKCCPQVNMVRLSDFICSKVAKRWIPLEDPSGQGEKR